MNTGAFGEGFPYTNFHDLNMDWIIKIAKDFLDQYTHIQQIIEEGEESISTLIAEGEESISTRTTEGEESIRTLTAEEMQALTAKKNELESLLEQWYTTHSNDIALQLATAISTFNSSAEEKARVTIASIPDDYSSLSAKALKAHGYGFTTSTAYTHFPEYMDLDVPVTPNEILGYGVLAIDAGLLHYPDKFTSGFTLINVCSELTHMSGGSQIAIDWLTGEIATRSSTGNPQSLTWTDWAYSGKNMVNYLKTATLTNNTVINESGTVISNQYTSGYKLTDYVEVNYGDVISMGYVRGTSALPAGVAFDEDHNPLFPLGFDDDYNGSLELVINDYRVKYIRYNVNPSVFINPKNNYLYVTPADYPVTVTELYVKKETDYTKFTNNWFNDISECAKYIFDNDIHNATITVLTGTYNILTEYGSTFFDEYDGLDRYSGVNIGNGCKWIFSEGAKITCNYAGINAQVATNFSPIVINGSCEIYNMNIEVTNCQYCVHDDYPTRYTDVHILYKNCNMKHNANTIGDPALSCIGGGTLPWEEVRIEGGYYDSTYTYPISYHTLWANVAGNYKSKLVIQDLYTTGGIALNDAPFENNTVDAFITNCSFGNSIGGTHTKFTIREWNNIVR